MNIADNKKARFDYDILETFEAGLVLFGHEVKSIKAGHMNLKGAYVGLASGGAVLHGAHVSIYAKASTIADYDPYRSRELLLHKKEMHKLMEVSSIKGLTVIPLRVYLKGRLIKIEIAIAKGKKLHDKRESIKKRDVERDMRRSLLA